MTRTVRQNGFTLIEVIVSIVTAAVLGSLLVTYMHSVFIRGGEQVTGVGTLHQLTQAMDGLTAAYNSRIHLAVEQTGEGDALKYVADQTGGGAFDPFDVSLGWFSGPPFTGTGNTGLRNNEDFLKVTLAPQGGGPSLVSIFWSGN